MKILHIACDTNGRITAASEAFRCTEDDRTCQVPDDFDISIAAEYRIYNQHLMHDPILELPTSNEKTDIEKLKIRTDANEIAISALMDILVGGGDATAQHIL